MKKTIKDVQAELALLLRNEDARVIGWILSAARANLMRQRELDLRQHSKELDRTIAIVRKMIEVHRLNQDEEFAAGLAAYFKERSRDDSDSS